MLPANVSDALAAGERDDHYGYGLFDAEQAVLAALEIAAANEEPETPPAPAIIVPSLENVDFGPSDEVLSIVVANDGEADLANLTATPGAPWVTAEVIGTEAPYVVKLTLDRSDAPTGELNTTVILSANDTDDVTFQAYGYKASLVGSTPLDIIVSVMASADDSVLASSTAPADSDGVTIPSIPSQPFYIIAGSDRDGDQVERIQHHEGETDEENG